MQVEQDRFVVQPFTMRSTDGAEGALLPHPDRRGSEGLHAQHSGHLLAPAVTAPRCHPALTHPLTLLPACSSAVPV